MNKTNARRAAFIETVFQMLVLSSSGTTAFERRDDSISFGDILAARLSSRSIVCRRADAFKRPCEDLKYAALRIMADAFCHLITFSIVTPHSDHSVNFSQSIVDSASVFVG